MRTYALRRMMTITETGERTYALRHVTTPTETQAVVPPSGATRRYRISSY
jgi:hypothetical protein